MRHFVERLEDRALLSVGYLGEEAFVVLGGEVAVVRAAAAAVQIPRITGTFKGDAANRGGHPERMVLKITWEGKNGDFKGTMYEAANPSRPYAVSGKVKANRTFTMTFSGKNGNGSTSGQVSTNGKVLSGKYTAKNPDGTFKGTFSFKK